MFMNIPIPTSFIWVPVVNKNSFGVGETMFGGRLATLVSLAEAATFDGTSIDARGVGSMLGAGLSIRLEGSPGDATFLDEFLAGQGDGDSDRP
jgi:hypothetical protein